MNHYQFAIDFEKMSQQLASESVLNNECADTVLVTFLEATKQLLSLLPISITYSLDASAENKILDDLFNVCKAFELFSLIDKPTKSNAQITYRQLKNDIEMLANQYKDGCESSKHRSTSDDAIQRFNDLTRVCRFHMKSDVRSKIFYQKILIEKFPE